MTSKSVCRRLAIQIGGDVRYNYGDALYFPKCPGIYTAEQLREIADTLDMLTEQKQKEAL